MREPAALALHALAALPAAYLIGLFTAEADQPLRARALGLAAACVLASLILEPASTTAAAPRSALRAALAWSMAMGLGALALIALSAAPALAAPLALGVALLCLALSALRAVLSRWLGSPERAALVASWTLGLASAAPLWLGPLAEQRGSAALGNAAVAVSPLSFLAVLADYDYLRSEWFYRHAVWGAVRFAYPPALWVGVIVLSFAAFLLLLAERADRKGVLR